MTRIAILCVLLLLLSAAARAADELTDAFTLLDRLDETLIEVDYDERPLGEVVDDLSRLADVPARADWPSLWQLGVRPRDPVSFTLPRAPASRVFSGLMLLMGDEFSRPVWEVHAGQIVITTEAGTGAMRLTTAYDVRDLIGDESVFERLRETRPPLAAR